MKPGTKPKATALKLVTGNPGKRALNADEPKFALSKPNPPPHLTDDARIEWRRVVTVLFNAGLLTEMDRAALAAYCQAYGRWAQAERALSRMADNDERNYALMVKNVQGNACENPLVGTARRALLDMMRCAVEFGMTPSARARVKASPDDQQTDLSEFFT